MGKMRMVEVEWEDPSSCKFKAAWVDREAASTMELLYCRSVGLLVKKDAKTVVLALNEAPENDEVGDVFVLPRSCVKKMRYLK